MWRAATIAVSGRASVRRSGRVRACVCAAAAAAAATRVPGAAAAPGTRRSSRRSPSGSPCDPSVAHGTCVSRTSNTSSAAPAHRRAAWKNSALVHTSSGFGTNLGGSSFFLPLVDSSVGSSVAGACTRRRARAQTPRTLELCSVSTSFYAAVPAGLAASVVASRAVAPGLSLSQACVHQAVMVVASHRSRPERTPPRYPCCRRPCC